MNACDKHAGLATSANERNRQHCTLIYSGPCCPSIYRREKNQLGNRKKRTGEEQATIPLSPRPNRTPKAPK